MTDHPTTLGDDFVWGVATSSFQIEGASSERGETIWDRFCSIPGKIADGTDGRIAADHVRRARDDIALMRELGINAYRFSIAWARVMPNGRGQVDESGLDFYDQLVDDLLDAGIEPYPTLYHWDLPQPLEEVGGWASRRIVDCFVDYAGAVAARLGDRVQFWTTLNEPFAIANHGYRTGEHAPGRTSVTDALAAAHHLLLAHGSAVPVIRAHSPGCEVGVVLRFTPVEQVDDDPAAEAMANLIDGQENRWFVEPLAGFGYPSDTVRSEGWDQVEVRDGDLEIIARPIDFLGVNYSTRQYVDADGNRVSTGRPITDTGWEIAPDGLYEVLHWLDDAFSFRKLLVTANGAAMPDEPDADGWVDDQDRVDYLRSHIEQVQRAVANQIPVAGYFAWSLLDNFEWAHGYAKRFGLVRVDPTSHDRTPKASFHFYRRVIDANGPCTS